MATAVHPFKSGLSSLVRIEEWRRKREDVRATFWSVRKSAAAVKQIDAVCLDLIAKSLDELGEYPALRKWLGQESNVWNRLKLLAKDGNNDVSAKDALEVLQDVLDSEKLLLQKAKSAA